MGCISGIAKYLLFLFNFIIFVCAVLLIVFGVLLKNDEGWGSENFENLSVSNLAIAVGVLVGLISFFGCFGACNGSSCLLTTYAAILITLFIIQIVLGILAYVAIKNGDDNDFQKKVDEYVGDLFDDYIKTNKLDDKQAFDALQKALKCCGPGHSSYGYLQYGVHGWPIPKSCCSDLDSKESCSVGNKKFNSAPCGSALETKLENNSKVIGGIAIGFGVIELICACFALYVRNSLHH